MSTGYGLEPQIAQLRYLRENILNDELLENKFHQEAELCYQMVSLYLEMDKVVTDKYYSKDYIQEKAETIFRLFRNLVVERIQK